jgi:hypothetical protein
MPVNRVGSNSSWLRQLLLEARQAQIDGSPQTGDQTKAVKTFQRSNQLTPDGVIGPKTNKILERYLSDAFDGPSTAKPTSTGVGGVSGQATSSGLDIDKAVAHLDKAAGGKSLGKCAKYVRQALEAGGLNTSGHPVDAKDYGPFLESKGFSKVDTSNGYTPQKGDIAVLPSNDSSDAGHVTMYDGKKWVSDFKQRDMLAGPSFRESGEYAVYRP